MTTTEPTILCPGCQMQIKLTESLAAPLVESTRQEFARRTAEQELEMARREAAVKIERDALTEAQNEIEKQIAERLKVARESIALEEAKSARLLLGADIEAKVREVSELKSILEQRDEKLAAAQRSQAEMLRKQRELDDARRELELTIEQRVSATVTAARDQARKEGEESLRLKVLEREQMIASLQTKIEDLKRRSEQGSQQLQGEVQELELEGVLRSRFPQDSIEPVGKGEHGGDVIQRVFNGGQAVCGTILWECKRTKNWSDGWLSKLREDQRAAKAEFGILVSDALPKNVEIFDLVDGIWITSTRTMIPVAIALRNSLLALSKARLAGEGQQSKVELVYQYLTGPRFRHRIEAIVEKFTDMQSDLEKERKAITRMWAKREEQIRCVIDSTSGMYGDLQGIAGKTLQEIDGLELQFLPDSFCEP